MWTLGVIFFHPGLIHNIKLSEILWSINTPEEFFSIGTERTFNGSILIRATFMDVVMRNLLFKV